jgi:hypothetical protein
VFEKRKEKKKKKKVCDQCVCVCEFDCLFLFFTFFFSQVSATLKNVYAPVPSVTRSKPVHFGAHPKGTHFIYASARNIVIRNVNVRHRRHTQKILLIFFFFFFFFFPC